LVDFGEACRYPLIGWHRRDRRLLSGWPRNRVPSAQRLSDFSATVWRAFLIHLAWDASGFPPPAAMVASKAKTACERPHSFGRSPSPWDGLELARQLRREGVVESIPPVTICRILIRHQLKPRCRQPCLSSHRPRNTVFCAQVTDMVDVDMPHSHNGNLVRGIAETTSLQPCSLPH